MADEPRRILTIPAGPPRPVFLDDFAMIGKLAEQTRERVSGQAPVNMESLGVLSWR
jgi:hypothetical protein